MATTNNLLVSTSLGKTNTLEWLENNMMKGAKVTHVGGQAVSGTIRVTPGLAHPALTGWENVWDAAPPQMTAGAGLDFTNAMSLAQAQQDIDTLMAALTNRDNEIARLKKLLADIDNDPKPPTDRPNRTHPIDIVIDDLLNRRVARDDRRQLGDALDKANKDAGPKEKANDAFGRITKLAPADPKRMGPG